MRRRGFMFARIAIVVTFLMTLQSAAQAISGPVKIVGGREIQLYGYGDGTWYDWTANSAAMPKHFDAYGRLASGTHVIKVNAAGTQGFTGSFDPSSTGTIIYQQVYQRHSDLYLFDLNTKTRTKLNAADSSEWEWQPRISATQVLFAREHYVNGVWSTSLLLMNRSSGIVTDLGSWKAQSTYVGVGQVGDAYATYTICVKICNAFVYNIAGARKHKIPPPTGREHYSPVVDETSGTVYFMRSGHQCGSNAGLWTVPVADVTATPVRLASLPNGVDTNVSMSTAPDPTSIGGIDVIFQRVLCQSGAWDIYAFRNVNQ